MNSKEINKFILAVIFCLFTLNSALPQVAINTDGAQPHEKSILDVASTSLGILLPRMTSEQRTAITSPPQGLLVFQIDGGVNAGLYYATGVGNNWTLIFHSNTTAITGTGSQNYIPYWTGTNALAFTGMYWDNTNGRLGIGTTSPLAKLQVDGNVFINNAAAPGFYGQSAGTNKVYLGYDGAGTGLELYNFQSTKSLKIQDDGYLTYLGNVGIGTTTPVSALQLGSLTSISTIVNNQSLFGNNMYYTGGQTGPGVWKYITTAPASAMRLWGDGSIRFHTVASGTAEATINIADMDVNGVKMIIQNGGNVGIGTTTPSYKLDISSATGSGRQDMLRILAGSNSTGNGASIVLGSTQTHAGYISGLQTTSNTGDLAFGTQTNGNYAENMRIVGSNGNVGIGTTSPGYKLHVAGGTIRCELGSNGVSGAFLGGGSNLQIYHNETTTVHFWNSANGNYGFLNPAGISSTGALFAASYNVNSDRRLKNNIVNTHFGINDLMKVQVRDYVYKSDSSKTLTTGFIAQELHDIFPNAVTKPAKEEDMWSVDYGKVTPLLVKAIQDQQSEITSLKSEMEQMKSDIQQLKSGNAPSNAGFGGNTLVVLLSVIGIALGVVLYRKVSK
ncbi:MAG: tail fiber domain-containing protein [Paludibacter sp.]